jgi:DNA-binding NtrC family response regulator
MIFPKHLPTEIRAKMARTSVGDEKVETQKRQRSIDRKQTLPELQALREAAVAEVEKNYLQELMSLTGGKVKDACRISGLSRSRLYELLKKYHVSTSG